MGNFSKYLEMLNEVKSVKLQAYEKMLDDAIEEYNKKFNKNIEYSSVGLDNKVAIFNGDRKIFEGYIYKAIDYIKDIVKNLKAT